MEPLVYPNVCRGQPLTGLVFGRWTVMGESRREGYVIYYDCLCICGGTGEVPRRDLLKHSSSSCGCLRTEQVVTRSTTHGLYHTPEHRVWASMCTRCHNPSYVQYHLYGGRGITVCQEWRDSYERFYLDMGPRPSSSHQIDRKENSLGYFKDNCYWATRSQNARNKRSTVFVDFEGRPTPLIEVSERLGIAYHALFYRYQKGERGNLLFRPSSKYNQPKELT